ncbi:hypothetical protein CPB83DRAFT_185827 [Crepidotus variabilis]|uniref:Uncharacterized protein n=1 Tax=Crepidotus variabilis TaxID=179855 RepID=A0A9P6EJL9_9AGAR|nr:hypothetical protein CPB83DRAFT_185827 [Crepidotus variabilis]
MFASKIVRNVGATGNRLMNEGARRNNNLFWGVAGLMGLTTAVYWAGYKAPDNKHKMNDTTKRQ